MRIKDLSLKNFHGFPKLDINLDGKSAVIFGINGAGKSSILKSVNIIFGRLIKRVVGANKAGWQDTIKYDDILFGTGLGEVAASFLIEGVEDALDCNVGYHKQLNRPFYGTEALADVFRFVFLYNEYAEELAIKQQLNFIVADVDVVKPVEGVAFPKTIAKANPQKRNEPLPVLINYGVNRTVFAVPLRTRRHDFERLETYKGATNSMIDFRSFFEWFRNQEDYERQRRDELRDFDYQDPALKAVRTAITTMMPDLSNIRVDRKPLLRMRADKFVGNEFTFSNSEKSEGKQGKKLRALYPLCIEQLSDGEKCTLALLGDLVRRLALANPESPDPLLGTGIVLIDEIELHMHPEWQRRIVSVLHEIFPNIQFIITTHSPQVIGELPEDGSFQLYRLESEVPTGTPRLLQLKSAYYDSNLVLEDYMGTDSLNRKVKALESQMFRLIEQGKYDNAQKICDEITELTNGTNPATTRAEVLIRRGRQKRQQ